MNQIPPRPESLVAHSWPPATPLSMSAELQLWGNGQIQGPGQEEGWVSAFACVQDHPPLRPLSAGTFKGPGHVRSSAEVPLVFSPGTSNSMSKKVTETRRALEFMGGRDLLGPIFASLCHSSEAAGYRKGRLLSRSSSTALCANNSLGLRDGNWYHIPV